MSFLNKILGKSSDSQPIDSLPGDRVVQFYGKWCGYCRVLEPVVEQLQEDGADILRLEVWGNSQNKALMQGLSDLFEEFNRGDFTVPTFYDARKPRSRRLLVNPMTYEEITDWMNGSGPRKGRRRRRRAGR